MLRNINSHVALHSTFQTNVHTQSNESEHNAKLDCGEDDYVHGSYFANHLRTIFYESHRKSRRKHDKFHKYIELTNCIGSSKW